MTSVRTKGARWTRRPDERPQELLEAALHVFATQGYRTTRLEQVAAAAGVTKGAVYHYFSNKEELLLRALELYQERAFGRLEEALRRERGPSSARIRLVFRRAFGGDDPVRRDVLRLLQGVAYEVPDAYRRWIAKGPMKGWRLVASLIEEGKASGEFRADVAARVVFTGVMVQMIWQRHADDIRGLAVDHDRLIDSAVDLLLGALRPAVAVRSSRGN
jgi:AcrR family transcriptional regulator